MILSKQKWSGLFRVMSPAITTTILLKHCSSFGIFLSRKSFFQGSVVLPSVSRMLLIFPSKVQADPAKKTLFFGWLGCFCQFCIYGYVSFSWKNSYVEASTLWVRLGQGPPKNEVSYVQATINDDFEV